jgi:hypothetical protein
LGLRLREDFFEDFLVATGNFNGIQSAGKNDSLTNRCTQKTHRKEAGKEASSARTPFLWVTLAPSVSHRIGTFETTQNWPDVNN